MRQSVIVLGAAAFAALFATTAFAADVYRPPLAPIAPVVVPASLWNGHYIGLQAGFSRDTADFTAPGETVPFGTINPEGWSGGARFGFDRQYGSFVLGVVGDINGGNIRADVIDLGGGGSDVHAKIDWLGTLRVRGGWAMNHLLVYGTGGVALAHVNATVTDLSGGGPTDAGSASTTHIGWTAGLGAELAISPRVSLFTEWLYSDYGSQSYHFENPSDPSSYIDASTRLRGNTYLAGLNFRFP